MKAYVLLTDEVYGNTRYFLKGWVIEPTERQLAEAINNNDSSVYHKLILLDLTKLLQGESIDIGGFTYYLEIIEEEEY